MDPKVTIWVQVFKFTPDKIEAIRMIVEEIFESINKVANDQERQTIRNAKVASAINQLDAQWREFTQRVGNVDPNGFAGLLRKKRPGDFQRWADLRVKIGKPILLTELAGSR